MARAISLAKLALGHVSPNPAVGAVIVKDKTVVGEGYTQPPGSWHAEVMALKQAGEKARGAVLYVTLEPCCHYGRTPPCTQAVIEAGISEVHAALIDPNPIVSGKGKAELERAGIRVVLGEHETEAQEITEAYAHYITTRMPFVTVKFAMSLDGKIATRTGDSKWITSEESRRYVHYLRYTADAIMVGVNTILADDPQLTNRCCYRGGTLRQQPVRVIVDTYGRTPITAKIFNEPGNVLMAVGKKVAREKREDYLAAGAAVVELPARKGLIDLGVLLKELGERQVASLLVEGGGTLLGSLFDARLVHKVIGVIAPVVIGGRHARTAVAGRGVVTMAEAWRLERVRVCRFNGDVMIIGYPGR